VPIVLFLTQIVTASLHLASVLKPNGIMAKESIAKENAVADALRRLRDEESELQAKLKPIQEAITALEKIVEKSVKKVKSSKDNGVEHQLVDENGHDAGAE
jgi:hypothetical protein